MKLGFIGTGNMATAMMGGIIENHIAAPEEIIGADPFAPGREMLNPSLRRISASPLILMPPMPIKCT